MENILPNQNRSNCPLALPDGLKELMSDISREVLRAQPQNLYDFIANYLSVMLLSREHLSIANHLCDTICSDSCYRELEDELRFLGFDDDKAVRIRDIVTEQLCTNKPSESKLMTKLMKEAVIKEEQLDTVRQALHKALKRHLVNNTVYYESSSDSDGDEVDLAANHTLKLYRKTNVSNEKFKRAVDNVKTSYRAYGVIRHDHEGDTSYERESESEESEPFDSNFKNIRFMSKLQVTKDKGSRPFQPNKLTTVSSSSLAGSYMNLPKIIPYSVHDCEKMPPVKEILIEKSIRLRSLDLIEECEVKVQKISFQDPEADDNVEVKSTSSVEEVISPTGSSQGKMDDHDHSDTEEIEEQLCEED